jgi:hypothetical protein
MEKKEVVDNEENHQRFDIFSIERQATTDI